LAFFIRYMLGRPGTSGVLRHSGHQHVKLQQGYSSEYESGLPSPGLGRGGRKDFGQAFGLYEQPRGWAYPMTPYGEQNQDGRRAPYESDGEHSMGNRAAD
jgi:hypothetical protein